MKKKVFLFFWGFRKFGGKVLCTAFVGVASGGFLYFALAFFVYKWLFVHVYTKQYDLMGETWHLGFQGFWVLEGPDTFILEDAWHCFPGPRAFCWFS